MDQNNDIKRKSSMGIAAFTLGIISIVFSIFWYLSIPSGILAIIFGKKSINKIGSKLGKAGFITGIIGLSLFLFIYLSIIATLLISNFM